MAIEQFGQRRTAAGTTIFYGELVNKQTVAVSSIQVRITGPTGANGNALFGGLISPVVVLQPGEQVVWLFESKLVQEGWQPTAVDASGRVMSGTPTPRIMTSDVAVVPSSTTAGGVAISGQVRNESQEEIRIFGVTVGAYDASGVLIAVARDSERPTRVTPGSPYSFLIELPDGTPHPARVVAFANEGTGPASTR